MFIQPCFIQKCTPALIEKLVGLGYKIVGKTTLSYGIFCNNGKIKICSTNEQLSIKDKNFIQCYDNEELFLALAALRGDSDSHQYFIFTKDVQMGPASYKEGDLFYSGSIMKVPLFHLRKATAEDIIERFTMKGGAE